jgi:hypothetical protein
LLLARPTRFVNVEHDEQFFTVEGWSLGKGLVPYRDFQEFKPPAIFVTNLAATKLFGTDPERYRYFFVILTLLAFLVVLTALMTRGVPRWIAFAVQTVTMAHFLDPRYHYSLDDSESIGVAFFLFATGLLLIRIPPKRARWIPRVQALGGIFFGLALLSKEPFLLPTAGAWLAIALLLRSEAAGFAPVRAFVKNTVLGALSVGVIWVTYMVTTGSLGWYVLQLKETMVYAGTHNELYGAFPSHLTFAARWAEYWERLSTFYVNTQVLAPFAPYFVGAAILWKRGARLVPIAVGATFLAALYAVTIGSGLFPHYFIVGMSGTFFVAIMAVVAMAGHQGSAWRRWAGISLAAISLCAVWPRCKQIWKDSPAYNHPYWCSVSPCAGRIDLSIVDFVKRHTTAADRIWNIGEPGLYILSDRRPASRLPYMHDSLLHIFPGATDEQRLKPYREELDKTLPKLVIVSESRSGRERLMDTLVDPFLRDHGYRQIRSDAPLIYERPL